MNKFVKFLISVYSILYINLFVFFKRILNSKIKIIFVYFPVKSDQKAILNFVNSINSLENCIVIYGYNLSTKNEIKKNTNSFFLDLGYLKFINKIDIFLSNYVVHEYPLAKEIIYINHDIYDTPMVDLGEEDDLYSALTKCSYIFLSSDLQITLLKDKIYEYSKAKNLINKTKLINTGYLKLDYVNNKLKNYKAKEDSIILAPTLSIRLRDFNLNSHLYEIIETILNNTELNLIYRPHPADIYNPLLKKNVENISKSFNSNKKFYLDDNPSYLESYARSKFLITDLSGTAYTYTFSTLKPVIFYSHNDVNLLKINNFNDLYFFKDRDKVGKIIKNTNNLKEILNFDFHGVKKTILDLRNLRIKYFANSTKQSLLSIKEILEKN